MRSLRRRFGCVFELCVGVAVGFWMGPALGQWITGDNRTEPVKVEDGKDSERWNQLNNDTGNIHSPKIICAVVLLTNNGQNLRAINATYSKRCNQIFLYSSSDVERDFDVVHIRDAQAGSWKFLSSIMIHLGKTVKKEEPAWVIFTDDQTYVIMDNLRHYLRENSGIGLAGRAAEDNWLWKWSWPIFDFYAGVVVNWNLILQILPHLDENPACTRYDRKLQQGFGECFAQALNAYGVDAIDEGRGGHRFLPMPPREIFEPGQDVWPRFMQPLFSWQDPATCCSDLAVTFGSLSSSDFYLLEYLIYRLRPHGIDFSG